MIRGLCMYRLQGLVCRHSLGETEETRDYTLWFGFANWC